MENKFTEEKIENLADLLMIGLSSDEKKMVLDEFAGIDKNIDLINEIPNIEEVEPMTHCLDDFSYELREDVVEDSVPIDELLQNCDEYNGSEVEVPRMVG